MQSTKFCRATLLSNQPCNRGPAAAAIRDLLHTAATLPPDVIANLTACATALEGGSIERPDISDAAEDVLMRSDDGCVEAVMVAQPMAQHIMPGLKPKHSSDEVSTAQLPLRKTKRLSEFLENSSAANDDQSLSSSVKQKKKKRSRDSDEAAAMAALPYRNLKPQPSEQPCITSPAADGVLDSSSKARKKKRRMTKDAGPAAAPVLVESAFGRSSAAPNDEFMIQEKEMLKQSETECAPARKKRKKGDNGNDSAPLPNVPAAKASKRKSDLISEKESATEANSQPKRKKKKNKP